MVVSESMVAVIFRVINTVAVALCGVYAFKKYAFVRIKDAMSAKERELIDLRLQGTKLGLEIKKFELQIKKEEENNARMQEQILRWRTRVDETRAQHVAQQESLLSAALEQQKIKNAYMRSAVMYNQVVPRALDTARVQLKHHFASSHAASAYMQDVITILQAGKR